MTADEHIFGHSIEGFQDDTKSHQYDSHLSSRADTLENKDSVFYMDKNVTACDLPQIVVCYKQNTYHVVKDICVDEGMPVQEKFLSSENDSCKSISDQCGSVDPVKVDGNANDLTAPVIETLESKSLDITYVKYKEYSHGDVKNEIVKTSEKGKDYPELHESSNRDYDDAEESRKCDQENLVVTGEVEDDANYLKNMPTLDDAPDISFERDSETLSAKEEVKTAGITAKESLTLADIMSMEDGNQHFNHNHEEQSSQESSGKICSESVVLEPEIGETDDSKTLMAAEEAFKVEKVNNGEENRSCTKNGDTMNISPVSTSQESTKTIELRPSKASNADSESGLRINEPDDPYDHSYSSHFPSSIGETSFSAVEPVSGHITYMGPIAFSGSLSVRSDGSTTSARSFAFPVLQSEWNSSPVRMAKADKRYHRNQKRWRDTLLCCRF